MMMGDGQGKGRHWTGSEQVLFCLKQHLSHFLAKRDLPSVIPLYTL